MTTIPETIRIISRDIQHTFESLMNLVLRKTLRPALYPLGTNTKIVYNHYLGIYERGYIGASPDDNIHKYSYLLTHQCLGWTCDAVTNFKAIAKIVKNKYPPRFPAGATKTYNARLQRNNIAYSERERKYNIAIGNIPPHIEFKNFVAYLTARNMQNTISNRKAGFAYACDMLYIDCFKQLESIGRDIINQTNPCIPGVESAKMSTARLRTKLFTLEHRLTELSCRHPNIYRSYELMVKTINTVPRERMDWVINLVAALSFQPWSNLTEVQKRTFIERLGEIFINEFNSNELITILLQSGSSDLIFTSSYLYSLLKMLFIVFGYTRLTPILGEPNGVVIQNDLVCETECEPVDECKYEFIKLFGDLYPTIVELMGGTKIFPPECLKIRCHEIPPNYFNLAVLAEYFWRYFYFSYCQYIAYIGTKQVHIALNAKIDAKTRYLSTL